MSKYAPLAEHLKSMPSKEWHTTFSEIERLIGGRLPPVARRHRAWWSNNADNSAMTRAWLGAGFRTERVSMEGEMLVFRKVEQSAPEGKNADRQTRKAAHASAARSPFGGLKGTVRVQVDLDLTEAIGEHWNAERGRL
jgi:hypothetical protein